MQNSNQIYAYFHKTKALIYSQISFIKNIKTS